MGRTPLNIDGEFLVGEDKVMDTILAIIFSAIFLYGITDAVSNNLTNVKVARYALLLFGIPAFFYIGNARNRRIYIRINKTGIYQDEELVTDWPNLLNAYISQKQTSGSIQDNFMLVVEHRKAGMEQGFRRFIPLTDTQNRSEEEVLEAVKFYWSAYRN